MSWLPRDADGLIDRVETLEGLKRYPQQRVAYSQALTQSDVLKERVQKVCLAIDIGVPSLAIAAKQWKIPRFTVFDHSWSFTFQAIWLEQEFRNAASFFRLQNPLEELRAAVDILEHDEATAKQVFLFPPPGTAPEYWKHWERVSAVVPSDIRGVFGGPADSETAARWRQEARNTLRLNEDDKAVLISAGGTGVWDTTLIALVDGYAEKINLLYHVFVFAPHLVNKFQSKLSKATVQQMGRRVELFDHRDNPRVHVLGETPGYTYQNVIAGVDVVISRAGWATVNDAIACAKPLVLVAEPHHWQVETIRRMAVDDGYAVSVSYEKFKKSPVETLEEQIRLLGIGLPSPSLWDAIQKKMSTCSRNRETSVAESLLGLV
jgi:hypothetical protein